MQFNRYTVYHRKWDGTIILDRKNQDYDMIEVTLYEYGVPDGTCVIAKIGKQFFVKLNNGNLYEVHDYDRAINIAKFESIRFSMDVALGDICKEINFRLDQKGLYLDSWLSDLELEIDLAYFDMYFDSDFTKHDHMSRINALRWAKGEHVKRDKKLAIFRKKLAENNRYNIEPIINNYVR